MITLSEEQEYPVLFNFSQQYEKLSFRVFTTIRSVNYHKNRPQSRVYKGAVGWITLRGKKLFLVKVVDYFDIKIKDIPLSTLQFDVAPIPFETHADFVRILNNILHLCGFRYGNNRLTTKKRIFILMRFDVWKFLEKLELEEA